MASAQILNNSKAMYVWNGTNWLPLNAQNNIANSIRWQKIADGGETTLSGVDDNGNVLYYSPGYEQVYLNGILLVRNDDYIANDGLSITDLDAISEGANINIIALKQLTLANTYTREQSDLKFATQEDLDNIDLSPYLTQISASVTYEPNITYSSSAPLSPIAGTLWVDNTIPATPILKVYNGSEWIIMSGAGGGGGLKTHFLLMGA
jgi:hypothetical protein